MVKCRNCGMELGSEQTCVFATYKVKMDGKELMVCCERCAAHHEEAPPLEAAPVHPVARRAAPHKRAKKAVKRAAPHRRIKNALKRAPSRKRRK